MDLDDYQHKAAGTSIYSDDIKVMYPALGKEFNHRTYPVKSSFCFGARAGSIHSELKCFAHGILRHEKPCVLLSVLGMARNIPN